jgi:choline dehydrogenase
MAVVDDELRVHGLTGLRIADASIMPSVASANTSAAVFMIAEKASDMILGSHSGPAASVATKDPLGSKLVNVA